VVFLTLLFVICISKHHHHNYHQEILKGFSKRGMFFARKFSTKKTPELLDRIDSYMIFNQSSEAGLFWPGMYIYKFICVYVYEFMSIDVYIGFLKVDTTFPGKKWVQNHTNYNHISNRAVILIEDNHTPTPLPIPYNFFY
jgi:hypothetical protein